MPCSLHQVGARERRRDLLLLICCRRNALNPPGPPLPSSNPTLTDAQQQASTSGRRFVLPRNEIPVDLLVARHDPRAAPASAICSTAQLRQAHSDAAWAGKREHWLAAAAAGFHVALFAWNLAFWGFEGMPPDRCVVLCDVDGDRDAFVCVRKIRAALWTIGSASHQRCWCSCGYSINWECRTMAAEAVALIQRAPGLQHNNLYRHACSALLSCTVCSSSPHTMSTQQQVLAGQPSHQAGAAARAVWQHGGR